MNKKFFAALTSAAMLLSSTGVVLANDFVEVPEAGVGGAAEEANFVNATNFPDKKFRDYLSAATVDGNANTDLSTYTKEKLAGIKTLVIPANKGISDLSGIEYFTGLAGTATVTGTPGTPGLTINGNGNYIDEIDLSANTALVNLSITGANDTITSVTLPNTITLQEVTVTGNSSLDYLDVSVAPALASLDVQSNGLVSLDASTNVLLKTVVANDNKLYEVKVPAGITSLNLNNNKIESFDASSLKSLGTLQINNNMLESLKVPEGSTLTQLDCSNNHLATLDLSKANGLNAYATTLASGKAVVNNQTVYSNPENKAVNMAEYDEKFNDEDADYSAPTSYISGIEDGVISFSDTLGKLREKDTPEVPTYVWNAGIKGGNSTMNVQIVAADLMNRLYNPNSGEHFYTKDVEEKDTLVKLGWQSEGIGWIAPDEDSDKAAAPVFRLYNANAGDHHYTTSANERDVLVTKGWKAEGIGWYSAEAANAKTTTTTTTGDVSTGQLTSNAATIEVFREYNPNAKEAGAHNYTISENENDTLVSLGWLDEGIGWWALK